jgi:ribosomal protein S18 acetylase RimI-like enzyme
MSKLHVRPAIPADAEAIHALTQTAYGEYRTEAAPSSALLETAREVREGLWSGTTSAVVAERDGRFVGAARFRADARGLYFFRLAVHPEVRRQGVAQALIDWLIEEARRRHAHRIWCQVRLIVPRNVALYEKNGFVITERHVVKRNGVEVPTATMEKRLESPALASAGVAAEGESSGQ